MNSKGGKRMAVRAAGRQRPQPLPAPEEKAALVRGMFGAIAPRYDLLNHLLSLNIDRRWRRQAVDLLLAGREARGTFLDVCAGTLDLSLELARRPGFEGRVVGADFALPMLQQGGADKVRGAAVSPACADALRLPFADRTFDGATVGFGVRNLADLDAGLRELVRVLRPGARLVVLEFAVPGWQPFRGGYLFYFRHVLPWIGRLISRHGEAYSYLPASVLEFPEPEGLAGRMEAAGFGGVRWRTATGGIVALHEGEKP
jgi:demethylmenaquinone methyltransferase / 2-methoxy-6-polyprenyl-1,4-benzoquinol methylase